MNIKRQGAALSFLAASALLLSACGSDNNTPAGGGHSGSGASTPNTSSGASINVECGGKKALKVSGSTAQANAMTRFVNAYETKCDGFTLNYTGNGSGAGVTEFTGKQTDFAGSDSPLDPNKGEPDKAKTRCDGNPAWDLPVVFGPIAVTYNVDGVDSVTLDGATLAKIFSGGITTWNDPAIAALNSGATLPSDKIHVVFRSDESGTTDNFQKYLTASSKGAWTKGAGKAFAGGVGEGAKGNDGTSASIKATKGSITYNEWSFAKAQSLKMAKVANSAGNTGIELTADSAAKAVDGAKIKGTGNDLVLDLNSIYATTTGGAYPIMLATYEIVCSKYTDADTGKAVKAFLATAISDGQNGLGDNGYVPLPKAFQDKLVTAVNAIA